MNGMKILIFGVSNVGKTTIGELLAKRLGYKFYDLDEETKKQFHMTLEEFVNTRDLRWRDKQRGHIINKLLKSNENMVIAITPISYAETFISNIFKDNILVLELYDTAENIFSRLIFSDENDNAYEDDEYKNKYKNHYIREIQADLNWYGMVNTLIGIQERVFMNNDTPDQVVERIITQYNLDHSD